MATVQDEMKSRISLHGLGFIQLKLQGGQRMHVWHPDLPKRHCFEHSAIHDHRFDFTSTVLVGAIRNISYKHVKDSAGSHMTYLHEGPRSPNGGRPWVPDGRINLHPYWDDVVEAGESYKSKAYEYHQTIVESPDGILVTIMKKGSEGEDGAHSVCKFGVEPDGDFDRFQLSEAQLLGYVLEALSGTKYCLQEVLQ